MNTLPQGVKAEDAELMNAAIPGIEPEQQEDSSSDEAMHSGQSDGPIPGLELLLQESKSKKKIPSAKPIPHKFQAQWSETARTKWTILPTPPGDEEQHLFDDPAPPTNGWATESATALTKQSDLENADKSPHSHVRNMDQMRNDEQSYNHVNQDDPTNFTFRGPSRTGSAGGLLGDFPQGIVY